MFQPRDNIVEVVRKACEKYSGLTAYNFMGQCLSYRELDELSDCFAAGLNDQKGLEIG